LIRRGGAARLTLGTDAVHYRKPPSGAPRGKRMPPKKKGWGGLLLSGGDLGGRCVKGKKRPEAISSWGNHSRFPLFPAEKKNGSKSGEKGTPKLRGRGKRILSKDGKRSSRRRKGEGELISPHNQNLLTHDKRKKGYTI